MLAEAGTGVGKTMAYLAPASLWAEANGPAVWVSTYTRALQRARSSARATVLVYSPRPGHPQVQGGRVRKGRENYLCLLNLQEAVNAAQLGNGDLIGLALAARWARATRDGDMTGGDFPAWLPSLFAVGARGPGVAGPANLVDRRRRVRPRRLHPLPRVLHREGGAGLAPRRPGDRQPRPRFDPGRLRRRAARRAALKADGESTQPEADRVPDEGSTCSTPPTAPSPPPCRDRRAAEPRRWIRGPESRGRRGRGAGTEADGPGGRARGRQADIDVRHPRRRRPAGRGRSGRIAPPSGEVNPSRADRRLPGVGDGDEQARPRRAFGDGPGGAPRGAPSTWCARPRARPRAPWPRSTCPAAGPGLASGGHPRRGRRRTAGERARQDRGRCCAGSTCCSRAADPSPAWRSMLQAIDENAEGDPGFRSRSGSRAPSPSAGWSTPPIAAIGSTPPSRSSPRSWRRRTGCW